ncbi:MAG: Holliday junction resolvase RuvX [Deltaproteobacteria bacterium]|nr:Holliday junction resolvase RuvX [Deltaproteobacteria bacterium]
MSRPIPAGEGRLLGVDFGTARLGLARSDPGRTFASPWKVIPYKGTLRRAAHLVAEAAREAAAVGVVVGLPLSMDGAARDAARAVRDFVAALEALTGLPVETADERLTTVEATRVLADAGLRTRAIRPRVDMIAAALILQGWLDRTGGAARGEEEGP